MAKQTSIEKLEAENRRLKEKVLALESQQSKQAPKVRRRFLRTSVITLLLGVSATILLLGQLFFWAGRTLTDTDTYVETVAPLIEKPSIQEAIAQRTTDAIFERVDVEAVITDALPERAAFLVTPLTTQVESYTYSTALRIVQSPQIADVWENVNRAQHTAIIGVIKSNASQDGVINLNEVYAAVNDELRDSPLKVLADRELPSRVGEITLLESERLRIANVIVTNLSAYRIISVVLFVSFLGLAVWLSQHRRRTLITAMVIYIVLLTLLAISIRIAKLMVVDNFSIEYQLAASDAWRVIATPLYTQLLATGILASIVATGAFLSGPSRSAKVVQARVGDLLDGNVHGLLFGDKQPGWSRWMGAHLKVINSIIVISSVVALAVAPITIGRVIGISLSTLVVLLFVRLLSTTERASGTKNQIQTTTRKTK